MLGREGDTITSDAGTEHRLGSRKEGEGVWFVCPNGWPCGCRRLVSVMAKMAKPIFSSAVSADGSSEDISLSCEHV